MNIAVRIVVLHPNFYSVWVRMKKFFVTHAEALITKESCRRHRLFEWRMHALPAIRAAVVKNAARLLLALQAVPAAVIKRRDK